LVASIFALRRRLPLEAFCLAWLVVTLLPVLNLVWIPQPGVERYLYLPSVGFCLLLALLMGPRLERGERVATVLAVAIVGASLAATAARNADWADDVRFWRKTVARTPQSADARLALGIAWRDRRDFPQALA